MNYYMNVYMLMNYDMKCICWSDMMILWCCNWTMYIYEIIMLMLSLLLKLYVVVVVVVVLVVEVVRCCWCCCCCCCRGRWCRTLLLNKLLSPCILIKFGAYALWMLIIQTRWFESLCSTRWFRSWCSTRWF